MNILLIILSGPLAAGPLPLNIALALAILLLKAFDCWSTNYIVGRKGGSETVALTRWLIAKCGMQPGLAVDFAIIAAGVWVFYPYWYALAGMLAWLLYAWLRPQLKAWRESRPE